VYQRERPRNSISDQEPDITVVKPERPDAAARITIPGFEQNQKNGVSALSAKRGCALTIRASARNSSEEPDISDFEILSALWLTQKRDLLAKTLHITAGGFSQGRKVRRLTCLHRVVLPTGRRSFSVSPSTDARLVY
jgi:hypothetical protein